MLDGAVEKLNRRRNSAVVVATVDGPRRVLLEHIRYVERVGRCMRYYCTDGNIDSQTIRVSFREAAAPLLADRRFCQCGASFVLNFQHVTGVNGQSAMLDDGQIVALPRTSATDFKKALGKLLADGSHGTVTAVGMRNGVETENPPQAVEGEFTMTDMMFLLFRALLITIMTLGMMANLTDFRFGYRKLLGVLIVYCLWVACSSLVLLRLGGELLLLRLFTSPSPFPPYYSPTGPPTIPQLRPCSTTPHRLWCPHCPPP